MSNAEIVRCLADGFTIPEIAKNNNLKKRGLEERVKKIRETVSANTLAQLVAKYLRSKIIE